MISFCIHRENFRDPAGTSDTVESVSLVGSPSSSFSLGALVHSGGEKPCLALCYFIESCSVFLIELLGSRREKIKVTSYSRPSVEQRQSVDVFTKLPALLFAFSECLSSNNA